VSWQGGLAGRRRMLARTLAYGSVHASKQLVWSACRPLCNLQRASKRLASCDCLLMEILTRTHRPRPCDRRTAGTRRPCPRRHPLANSGSGPSPLPQHVQGAGSSAAPPHTHTPAPPHQHPAAGPTARCIPAIMRWPDGSQPAPHVGAWPHVLERQAHAAPTDDRHGLWQWAQHRVSSGPRCFAGRGATCCAPTCVAANRVAIGLLPPCGAPVKARPNLAPSCMIVIWAWECSPRSLRARLCRGESGECRED
jgi:hypothetical protein